MTTTKRTTTQHDEDGDGNHHLLYNCLALSNAFNYKDSEVLLYNNELNYATTASTKHFYKPVALVRKTNLKTLF